MYCNCYEELREKYTTTIRQLCPNYENLTAENQFIYLLTAENKIAGLTAKFINDAFKQRENCK